MIEWIGDFLSQLTGLRRISDYIARKTQGKSISGLRIGYALVVILLLFGLILGISALLGLL